MREVTIRGVPGSKPVYAFAPSEGSKHFAMIVSPEEYRAILLRGHATLDGVKAYLVMDDDGPDETTGFMRFQLEEPYKRPETL
jgi:hypothetical protein